MLTRPPAVIAAAGALALFGAGIAAGRYSAAAPDVQQTEQLAAHVTQWDRTQYVHDEHKDRVVVREVFRSGPVAERTTDHETTDTHDTVDRTDGARADVTEHRIASSVTPRPGWHLGAGPGLAAHPALALSGPLTVDALFERRLAGPFWLAVHASTAGSASLLLVVEW